MSLLRKIPAMPVVALILLSLPLSLAAQRWKKKKKVQQGTETGVSKVDYKSEGAAMPQIRGVFPGKAVYTTKDLQNGANLFVMLFNPTCEHCEAMTLAFQRSLPLFKKSNIILLAAPHMGPYLEYFQNNTHLANFPAIKLGLDSAGFIEKTFRYESLPQVNVYNPEGRLLKSYSGITEIDSLKAYIQ